MKYDNVFFYNTVNVNYIGYLYYPSDLYSENGECLQIKNDTKP